MPKTIQVPLELKLEIRKHHAAFPDVSARKIAKLFGLHHKTVSRILSDVPTTVAAKELDANIEALLSEDIEEVDPEMAGKWVEGDRYVYNGDLDAYTFFLRTTTKKQVIAGTTIRAMKRSYSNMGNAATINEIARSFSIRRDVFDEIRGLLGWTHDSDPFTDEEVLARSTTDLVEDAVQLRRSKLEQEFNRRDWRDTKRDAERYRQIDHFVVQPLVDRLAEVAKRFEPKRLTLLNPKRRFAAVTSSGELHYNKHGWVGETGETYTREVADSRLEATTAAMVSSVALYGRPEQWVYIVGNDDMHVDNLENKTTAGTRQDVNGTTRQMIEEFFELQVREIHRLESVAPVIVKLSAGNHNTLLSYVTTKLLKERFRDSKNVRVDLTGEMRSYEVYGNTLMGFTHGHTVKPIKLMQMMGIEAREYFSETLYKAWFTAHFHSLEVESLVGGTRYQMPALSGIDSWHATNGYLGQPGLSGYIADHEYGVTATLLCPAIQMPEVLVA